MRVKLTIGNRLTLPKSVLSDFPDVRYSDVTEEAGRIVLTPVRVTPADDVRGKLAGRGITGADVDAAVARARRGA